MSDFNEDEMNEATYSFKAARAGKDIGKPGKMFSKIAKSAGEKYGSEERGKKVAGAVLAKIRAKHGVKEEVEQIDEIGNTPAGKKALASYIGKRAKSLDYDSDTAYGLGQDDPDAWDKLDSGTKGIQRAAKRLTKEEVEEFEELSKDTVRRYEKETQYGGTHKNVKGNQIARAKLHGSADGYRARVPAKEEVELDECDVLDTSMSDVAPSEKGEVYKKTKEKSTAATKPTGEKTHVVAGKTGEAYNTTAATKRNLALESAIRDVMTRSLDTRRIYNESAQIAIVSPEQRSDWMNVEQGKMHVVDYFNKYRTEEEQ